MSTNDKFVKALEKLVNKHVQQADARELILSMAFISAGLAVENGVPCEVFMQDTTAALRSAYQYYLTGAMSEGMVQ